MMEQDRSSFKIKKTTYKNALILLIWKHKKQFTIWLSLHYNGTFLTYVKVWSSYLQYSLNAYKLSIVYMAIYNIGRSHFNILDSTSQI